MEGTLLILGVLQCVMKQHMKWTPSFRAEPQGIASARDDFVDVSIGMGFHNSLHFDWF